MEQLESQYRLHLSGYFWAEVADACANLYPDPKLRDYQRDIQTARKIASTMETIGWVSLGWQLYQEGEASCRLPLLCKPFMEVINSLSIDEIEDFIVMRDDQPCLN